jgi:hypothetical protein
MSTSSVQTAPGVSLDEKQKSLVESVLKVFIAQEPLIVAFPGKSH